ncbi:MAG: hypothetical protein ACREA0_12865, partial [bacterium]
GMDSQSGREHRVHGSGLDTEPVTRKAWGEAFRVVEGSFGYGETFTSWIGLRGVGLEPGWYNLTVQASRGLDGGQGATLGGSMRLAAQCSRPLTVRSMLEDPRTLWLTSDTMNGSLDVTVSPFALEIHEGTLQHATANRTWIQAYAGPRCQGTLKISGPLTESFEWAPRRSVLNWTMREWTGPAGAYELAWNSACAALSNFGLRMLSFNALPREAYSTNDELPF